MDVSSRVAAVVVTFNRAALLLECLESLMGQSAPLGAIYVIDNASTDGTRERLEEKLVAHSRLLRYHRLPVNVGGAGGFSFGMEQAYRDGWDWIWLMDDDAEPAADCLQRLTDGISELAMRPDSVNCICPLVVNAYSEQVERHQHKTLSRIFLDHPAPLPQAKYVDIDGNAFVGPLFSKGCVAACGYPPAAYFLWVDDLDYTYRVSRKGQLTLDTEAVIRHKDRSPAAPGPDKRYYWVRNYLYFVFHTVRSHGNLRGRRLDWARALAVIGWRSMKYSAEYARGGRFKLWTAMLPVRGFFHAVFGVTGRAPE